MCICVVFSYVCYFVKFCYICNNSDDSVVIFIKVDLFDFMIFFILN